MFGIDGDDPLGLSDSGSDDFGATFPDEGGLQQSSLGEFGGFGSGGEMDQSLGFGSGGRNKTDRVSENREDQFELSTGRFRGGDGSFEPGSPPPDFDTSTRRYRAKDGKFKNRSQDLYDEKEEVRKDSLAPLG